MGNSVFFLSCCCSTARMWLGKLKHEKFPSFTSSSPHVGECGFRNPRNFCWWNPESGKLLVESGILGFGIRNPSKDLYPESKVPLTKTGIQYLESGIQGVESRIQDCLRFPYIERSSWMKGCLRLLFFLFFCVRMSELRESQQRNPKDFVWLRLLLW